MKTVFIISFAANLVLLIVSAIISPAKVAIHFGSGGNPNGWAPSYVNTLIMAGTYLVVFLSFLFSGTIIRKLPNSLINLPNKDYWLSDENRIKTEAIISKETFLFGSVIFAFLFIVSLLVLQANLSTPVMLREDLFWPPFGIFIAFSTYWTIRLMTKFKLPERHE